MKMNLKLTFILGALVPQGILGLDGDGTVLRGSGGEHERASVETFGGEALGRETAEKVDHEGSDEVGDTILAATRRAANRFADEFVNRELMKRDQQRGGIYAGGMRGGGGYHNDIQRAHPGDGYGGLGRGQHGRDGGGYEPSRDGGDEPSRDGDEPFRSNGVRSETYAGKEEVSHLGRGIDGGIRVRSGDVPLISPSSQAAQSSDYNGWGVGVTAAIDGDTSTFTHTDNECDPWWEVDVAAFSVNKVTIWNRMDCCSERLFGALIQLQINGEYITVGTYPESYSASETFHFAAHYGVDKIAVKIPGCDNILSLVEVQAWGVVTYGANEDGTYHAPCVTGEPCLCRNPDGTEMPACSCLTVGTQCTTPSIGELPGDEGSCDDCCDDWAFFGQVTQVAAKCAV